MRPGIRDAVVSVGILFFVVKCAAAAPAPALEKDDLFAPYAKGVPKGTTVISEETKDGVKVTNLRFTGADQVIPLQPTPHVCVLFDAIGSGELK